MNPKHVTDLELSKQLFEAGITKGFESECWWVEHDEEVRLFDQTMLSDYATSKTKELYPALLLSELLELMPKNVDDRRPGLEWLGGNTSGGWVACYFTDANRYNACSSKCPLEALSSLASYLIREGKFNNNAK